MGKATNLWLDIKDRPKIYTSQALECLNALAFILSLYFFNSPQVFFLEIPPYLDLDFPCSVQRYIEVQNLFQGRHRD